MAQQEKASFIIQPFSPIAYSLTMCQEGSNSFLTKCRIATKASENRAVANDHRAAVPEIVPVELIDNCCDCAALLPVNITISFCLLIV